MRSQNTTHNAQLKLHHNLKQVSDSSSPLQQFLQRSSTAGLMTLAIAVSISSFASAAYASRCRTIAQDWDGSVDVRSQPRRNIFNLITTIPNGTRLDVIGQRGDWLEIYAPDDRLGANYQTGWVAEKQTRRICSRDDRPRYPSSPLTPLRPLPPLPSLPPID